MATKAIVTKILSKIFNGFDIVTVEKTSDKLQKIVDALRRADGISKSCTTSKNSSQRVEDGWDVMGPPHKRRYAIYKMMDDEIDCAKIGPLLESCLKNLMQSNAFRRWLTTITGFDFTHSVGCCRSFKRGYGYSLSHEKCIVPRLDCVLSFVVDDDEEKAELWELGNVGGFQCYVSTENDDLTETDVDGRTGTPMENGLKSGSAIGEDIEDENVTANAVDNIRNSEDNPAVYRPDVGEEEGLLNIPATCNSLSVVLCEPGVLDFVKFVSSDAPSSRWDICLEMSVLSEVV